MTRPSYLYAFFALISTCLAFDIGHHHDLTVTGLRQYGFTDDAINVVLIHNWFTDFYSSFPSPNDPGLNLFTRLHFDNLLNSNEVKLQISYGTNLSRLLNTGLNLPITPSPLFKTLLPKETHSSTWLT
jgi:hypothetical protein